MGGHSAAEFVSKVGVLQTHLRLLHRIDLTTTVMTRYTVLSQSLLPP